MPVRFTARTLRVTLRDTERSFTLDASGFDLDAGQIMALTGASGCGKTLLLEVLCLIRRPDPGCDFCLRAPDQTLDLGRLWDSPHAAAQLPRIRATTFGFVPQSGGLLPFLTAAENVSLSQKLAGRRDQGVVRRLMATLGIDAVGTLYPDALSIGQRQRVAIARALAHRPAAIIADEPTAALDPEAAATVLDLLISVARDTGTAVLLSSHDRALLERAGVPCLRFDIAPADAQGQVISCLGTARAHVA